MAGGPADHLTWLLSVYQALDIPHADPMQFRDAAIGWLVTTGRQSLVEIFEASQRAGVRDEAEPDVTEVDAARLYAWVDHALDPRHRLQEFSDPDSVKDALTLPHRRMYAELTGGIAPLTSDAPVLRSIADLLGLPGIAAYAPFAPDTTGSQDPDEAPHQRRGDALRDWTQRHIDRDLLRNVHIEHVPALYLATGPDVELLQVPSTGGIARPAWPQTARWSLLRKTFGQRDARNSLLPMSHDPAQRLRAVARSMVRDALTPGSSRSALPLLLQRDERFMELLAGIETVSAQAPGRPKDVRLGELNRALEDYVAGLADELPTHREMALEAVSQLPALLDRVWWASMSDARHIGPDGWPETVTVEELHQTTTSPREALNTALKMTRDGRSGTRWCGRSRSPPPATSPRSRAIPVSAWPSTRRAPRSRCEGWKPGPMTTQACATRTSVWPRSTSHSHRGHGTAISSPAPSSIRRPASWWASWPTAHPTRSAGGWRTSPTSSTASSSTSRRWNRRS